MDQKIWINRGERAFHGDVYRAMDRCASAKGGRHVVDCAFFAKDGGWTYDPVSIYYAPVRPKDCKFENRYFGFQFNKKALNLTIFDADRVEEIRFTGLVVGEEFVFSRWRHDFRPSTHGSVCVDGGLDYFRAVGHFGGTRRATFGVRNGEFVEIT
jgi:hypothetical protein